jgi:hypothetical protein
MMSQITALIMIMRKIMRICLLKRDLSIDSRMVLFIKGSGKVL